MSMDNDNKFQNTLIKKILNSHKSIRWVGIIDKNGIIINEKYREGLKPLLTKEENQESAINTITRHKTRKKYEAKIGKLTYTFGRYENLSRSTIPINENYSSFSFLIKGTIFPLLFYQNCFPQNPYVKANNNFH